MSRGRADRWRHVYFDGRNSLPLPDQQHELYVRHAGRQCERGSHLGLRSNGDVSSGCSGYRRDVYRGARRQRREPLHVRHDAVYLPKRAEWRRGSSLELPRARPHHVPRSRAYVRRCVHPGPARPKRDEHQPVYISHGSVRLPK